MGAQSYKYVEELTHREVNERTSILPLVTFGDKNFCVHSADSISHRRSLVNVMLYYLNLPVSAFSMKQWITLEEMRQKFTKLQIVLNTNNDFTYSWKDIKEFANTCGESGELAELIKKIKVNYILSLK